MSDLTTYVVSVADRTHEFDFGGDVVARFKLLGDAYAYAKGIRDRGAHADVRVTNSARTHKVEFYLPVVVAKDYRVDPVVPEELEPISERQERRMCRNYAG